MKTIALVVADVERDPLGAPSTLAADLAGKNVLLRTLSRLKSVPGIEGIVVAAPADQEAKVRELAAGVPLKAVLRTQRPRSREMMASARAFGRYGWRGGLAGTTVYDEIYDPAAVLEVLQQTGAEILMLVAGGAALLDVQWTAAMLKLLHENEYYPFSFCQSPPGLSGLAITARTAGGVLSSRQFPGRLFAYQPGGGFVVDPIHQPYNVTLSDTLIATYRRLLADSPRGLWVCRQILEQLGENADGAAICRAAQSLGPEPWPRELSIELTTRRPIEDDLRYSCQRDDMNVEKLPVLLAGLEEAGDINTMFAGGGDALLHSQWQRAAQEAAKIGVAGLATYGATLDDGTIDQLLASPVRVVQVYVDGNSEESYSAFKRGCTCAGLVFHRKAFRGQPQKRARGPDDRAHDAQDAPDPGRAG